VSLSDVSVGAAKVGRPGQRAKTVATRLGPERAAGGRNRLYRLETSKMGRVTGNSSLIL
jgi:hypothetical protein